MSVIRLCNKVPEVYSNTSRDFQLIARLYDSIINGVKFDVDSIEYLVDTQKCENKVLPLLQEKIGFFSEKKITDEKLRQVLLAFPDIVKWKGSIEGIERAVRLFLKINGIKTSVYIYKVNKSESNPYTIDIGLDMDFSDTTILDEVLKYILPTGYGVTYSFYSSISEEELNIESRIGINVIIVKDSVNSLIRGSYITYRNRTEDFLLGSVGAMQVALPYDTSFIGVVDYYDELSDLHCTDEDIGKLYTIKYKIVEEVVDGETVQRSVYSPHSAVCVKHPSEHDATEIVCEYVEIETGSDVEDRDVFASSQYGYYINSKLFYKNKNNLYTEDQTYSGTGLEIVGNSDVNRAIIDPDGIRTLYDPTCNMLWISEYDSGTDAYVWTNKYFTEYGVEIAGNPTGGAYIIPKEGLVAYRPFNSVTMLQEAIWRCTFFDNEIVWGDMITDKSEIDSVKYYTHVIGNEAPIFENDTYYEYENGKYVLLEEEPSDWATNYENYYEMHYNAVYIYGTPNNAAINPKYTKACYTTDGDEYISMEMVIGSTIEYYWEASSSVISSSIWIIGSPVDGCEIIPDDSVHVYNSNTNKSWTADLSYSDPVGTASGIAGITAPDTNVLYIDMVTSNGYRWNNSLEVFERVMLFEKAENVYEISQEELEDMIEDGSLRPAFKDNRTIFRDIYGNILLL